MRFVEGRRTIYPGGYSGMVGEEGVVADWCDGEGEAGCVADWCDGGGGRGL